MERTDITSTASKGKKKTAMNDKSVTNVFDILTFERRDRVYVVVDKGSSK